MINIHFYKCNGNGNSFIIINCNNSVKNKFDKVKISDICRKIEKNVIDGLILIDLDNNNYAMDYYNNDGSWETLCLNGLRWCSLIIYKKFNDKCFSIKSNNIEYKIKIINKESVEISLKEPIYKLKDITVKDYKGSFINSGAKHFVVHYKREWPNKTQLEKIFQSIRYDNLTFPDGINVNFYKIINNSTIEVKTYEKGIESIMKSCASGSYAAAYDYVKNNKDASNKIKVLNDCGTAQIIFNSNFKENMIRSKAMIEYSGEITI